MYVYQAANGKWILFDGENKIFFNLESEARNMASKIKFAEKCQKFSATLAELFSDAEDLENVYFDEGFNGGGGDQITDVNVASLNITAADIASFITVSQQLQKFDIGNLADPVITADYGATINRMRSDFNEQ